jgi:hypothetical protein
VLVAYRIHQTNTSFSNLPALYSAEQQIFSNNMREVTNVHLSIDRQKLLYRLVYGRIQGTFSQDEYSQLRKILLFLWQNFTSQNRRVRRDYFAKELLGRYFMLLRIQKASQFNILLEILNINIGNILTRLTFLWSLVNRKISAVLRR